MSRRYSYGKYCSTTPLAAIVATLDGRCRTMMKFPELSQHHLDELIKDLRSILAEAYEEAARIAAASDPVFAAEQVAA